MDFSLFCIRGNTRAEISEGITALLKGDSGDLLKSPRTLKKYTLSIVAESRSDFRGKLVLSSQLLKEGGPVNHSSGIYFETFPFGESSLAFVFPGQGSQYPKMLSPLFHLFPGFMPELDAAFSAWKNLDDRNMQQMIYADESVEAQRVLSDTLNGQPAIGIVSDALSASLMKAGIVPRFFAGHSYGELSALKASGAFERETFLYLSRERGRLLANAGKSVPGCMTAVMAPAREIMPLFKGIDGILEIANYNSPLQVVVSGEIRSVEQFEKKCSLLEIKAVRLKTSCAFHSSIMSSVTREWENILINREQDDPGFRIPVKDRVYSNYTSEPYSQNQNQITENLYKQVENPVFWDKLCENMYEKGARIFLETGPGSALTGLSKRIFAGRPHLAFSSDITSEKKLIHLMAKLSSHNIPLDWTIFYDASILPHAQISENPDCNRFNITETQAFIQKKGNVNGASMARHLGQNNLIQGVSDSGTASSYFEGNSNVVQSFFNVQEALLDKMKSSLSENQLSTMVDSIMEKNARIMDDFMQAQHLGISYFAGQYEEPGPFLETEKKLQPKPRITDRQIECLNPDPVEPGIPSLNGIVDSIIEWTQKEICGITGFPNDVVTPDAEFDNDLGLDSLTLMQVFMALIKEYPDVENIGEKLRSAKSLSSLHEIISASSVFSGESAEKKSPGGADRILKIIERSGEVIVDVTGFPEEMVTAQANFSSDLGIDSISLIQIFMTIINEYPEIEKIGDKLRTANSLESLSEIIENSGIYTEKPVQEEGISPATESPLKDEYIKSENEIFGPGTEKWLLERLGESSLKDSGDMNNDSKFSKDLGIDIFEMEKIIKELTVKLPEISIAGFELLRADSVNELKNCIKRIIPQHRKENGVSGRETERFIIVEQNEGTPFASYGDQLPQRLILAGRPGEHYEKFKHFLKDNACELIQLQSIKKNLDFGWELIENEKQIFFKFDEIQELASSLEKYSDPDSMAPVLIVDTIEENLLESENFTLWQEHMEFGATAIFVLAKALLGNKKEAGLTGELFAYIHCGDNYPSVRTSAGVMKSLSREWPGVNVKYARFGNPENANDLKNLISELLKKGEPGKEIIVNGHSVSKLSYSPRLLQTYNRRTLNINKDSVLLLTGGGDGITSEIGFMLAEKYKCHIVSLGRTEFPETETPYMKMDYDSELKKMIYNDLKSEGKKVSAVEVMTMFKRVKRQQAILKNRKRVIDAGGQFSYFTADVTKKAELENAVDGIKSKVGSINGFIHGAGIIEDKMVSNKTVQSFTNVLHTKAHSIYHLYHLLKDEPLEFVVLLSSVTSFTGTIGQTDYAAANEVLNGTAAYWNEKTVYPVKSMLWSVWKDAGLAGDALKNEMDKAGLGTISTQEGVELFLDELTMGDQHESVVLFSPLSTLSYLDNFSGLQVASNG